MYQHLLNCVYKENSVEKQSFFDQFLDSAEKSMKDTLNKGKMFEDMVKQVKMQQKAFSITSIPKKQYEKLKSIVVKSGSQRIFKSISEKVLVTNFNLQADGLTLILQGNDLLQYQSNVTIGKSSIAVHMS